MYNPPIKKRARKSQELKSMTNLLNSDRIRLTFKDYDLEVLLQNDQVRVSNLHAKNAMKTCAIVNYSKNIPSWLQETHKEIYQGASIGETIKKSFKLKKEGLYLGETKIPSFAKIRMAPLELEIDAAVYIYNLLVQEPNSDNWISYCTITEIYCPSYLMLGDLKILHPQTNSMLTDELNNHFSQLTLLDIPPPIAGETPAGLN